MSKNVGEGIIKEVEKEVNEKEVEEKQENCGKKKRFARRERYYKKN